MYGVELSSLTLIDIKDSINELNLKRDDAKILAVRTAKKLFDENISLFRGLFDCLIADDEAEDEPDKFSAVIDTDAARHLRNIRDISDRLIDFLKTEPLAGSGAGRKTQLLWELEQVRDQAAMFAQHDELICWIETSSPNAKPGMGVETLFCAIPKNLNERLYDDIWSKGIPTILTSGTLSSGAGDFTRTKQTLGLDRVKRLTETSKPSPFDYHENAILYISENTPFPDQRNKDYITSISDEIEKLIFTAHGHTAVLFTSFKAMDMVWEQLANRGIPFPFFRLDKGGIREIDRFKKSGNGVLFAAGALWEGIDIPGDALSMLIVVKLPFAVPDPISEYERSLFKDMDEYKWKVIVPEMLIKLKQGFGRLIRTETDTGVVAILDRRANMDGAYRDCSLDALPDCYVTDDIVDVIDFIRAAKPQEYFE
jgi:ATP-dependent DNA helicase DinG